MGPTDAARNPSPSPVCATGSHTHSPAPTEFATQDPSHLSTGNSEFVAFVDAIGEIDGKHYLIDWKTTTAAIRKSRKDCGPGPAADLLFLDERHPDVAMVVFVRKRLPEIQYLKTSITEEQQKEYGHLVETTISQIESGLFPSHSGIRFPMNGCTSCAHLGCA